MSEGEDDTEAHWNDKLKGKIGSLAGLRERPSTITNRSLEGRQASEAAIGGPEVDGRRQRATGRTVLLGVRVSPDTKKALKEAAKKTGRPEASLVEYLLKEGLPGLVIEFGKGKEAR